MTVGAGLFDEPYRLVGRELVAVGALQFELVQVEDVWEVAEGALDGSLADVAMTREAICGHVTVMAGLAAGHAEPDDLALFPLFVRPMARGALQTGVNDVTRVLERSAEDRAAARLDPEVATQAIRLLRHG